MTSDGTKSGSGDIGDDRGTPPAVPPKQKTGHAPFLGKLGLLKFYPNKLTLKSLLEISHDTISDKAVQSLEDIPLAFLRKLLMVNAKCRNYTAINTGITPNKDDDDDEEEEDEEEENDDENEEDYTNDSKVNPLDMITALYLCADSFLQQEMAIKMSMCQFAIPFLLPQSDNSRCCLMLWALRNIYKEWRPHDLSHKNYVEDSVVLAQIPVLSFVRLGKCSLSKSQLLNHVLGNAQQNINVFTHRDMTGGNAPKKIANGLVEIAWCLPCGKNTIDVFPEPVAIANMRGEITSFDLQFSFLVKVSAAVFVFLDTMTELESQVLDLQGQLKSKLFLVINSQKKGLQKKYAKALQLKEDHVLRRERKLNMAESSSLITDAMKTALKECKSTITLEKMSDIAHNIGISVDENTVNASVSAKETAENIMQGIGVRPVADYKKKQLPLQGECLKEIAKIEIEECRLQNAGAASLEEYRAQLREKKRKLRQQQGTIKISQAAGKFIQALSTEDKHERTFFLRWMAFQLDRKSRRHLTKLRREFKDVCQGKDKQSIKELDQKLLDNSLGIEHYLREMGQIYEAKPSENVTKNLPEIAAELLLDGYPMELLDGDASNIPEKWVTDVLMKVHKKVERSRLLVVSVLGVQSTGKSTLLNTMFGVQFPVSSGRCTRGVYMLFLSIQNELREKLQCDFVLLIDTEGLKSPELTSLDDSYEHDNQLATLVIGLSDVTIINIAMENSTEMKDVLQIAVHAFLRMTKLGKKPVCHFVHQNVSGVSAQEKLMTDREHFLDQLNEITAIVSGMEKLETKKFTDVLTYDIEKNNWYIPGLWHGTPPMAPVNSGYSEAVHEFKESLLQPIHTENVSDIPDFLNWMSSLWKSVKYENFIFSFRNPLVAYAYDSLCKEFSEWEWSFRRTVHEWTNNAETQISNANSNSIKNLAKNLKSESSKVIQDQTTEMNKNLREYYKRRDRYVNLVQGYKSEFEINIKGLSVEMMSNVTNQLHAALSLKKNMEQVENIQKEHTDLIEKQVVTLLKTCKERKKELTDDDLKTEFEKMWKEVTRDISSLEEKDIPSCVMKRLRSNLHRRNVQEQLGEVTNLCQCGSKEFQVKKEHFAISTTTKIINKIMSFFNKNPLQSEIEDVANNTIHRCNAFIEEAIHSRKDYQDTCSKELLETIDAALMPTCKKTNHTFEVELKVHICGIASRKFLEMHRRFLAEKDPFKHLEKCKKQYLSDFIDSYRQRDQCLRKAQDLSQVCIKPAITEYINRSLGIAIVDGILSSSHSSQYSSRSYFQYTILSELLEKDDFNAFVRYLLKYEIFVKDLIYKQIVEWLSKDNKLIKLKKDILKMVMTKITEVVENKIEHCDSNVSEKASVFVERLCVDLSKDLSLNSNAIRGVLFQMSCDRTTFTDSLLQALEDLRDKLEKEFSDSSNVEDILSILTVKPHNEIFTSVFGCGVQCPFCKIPCEAGGKAHTKHHATVHRPQGLGRYAWEKSQALVEDLCTTSVYSGARFRNHDTNYEWHPYKEFNVYYPEWNIAPDPSIQASDYWKYVLVKYNDRFAKKYHAKPAVCPEEWKHITEEQALQGLKAAYNVKQ